jgi:DNA polymerase-3 subunit gamma/tau
LSYQVLARKWRPQSFDDVLGQQAVTRTLANALTRKRLAHAYVFAGPRGCGKTTTARILARALSCERGPTPQPCGTCEACVEIAEGRDIDVLEIDAATHTGVDNVREVIIEGLSIAPVRDRYKIFIIDEVHMLSTSSFNALLKSLEEPPPHVIFMMATTELHKIPDTVLSRSQVHEFKTIASKVICERLKAIAGIEQISIGDDALALLARAGEGSMRDALSAFDQVRAFAGDTIGVEDVVTVLGLVGRDLVLDMFDAVAQEDAPAAFVLVEQAIERGYDLRLLCRELARAARDLLLLSVDPSRASDPDVAGEGDRKRLADMGRAWSREDLLRAFDLLTRAEQEVRTSDQPRFNLEMALLRLMHLRNLVPLSDLLMGAGASSVKLPSSVSPGRDSVAPTAAAPQRATRSALAPASPPVKATPSESSHSGTPATLKDRLLSEIRAAKPTFYNVVVAQAYRIDVEGGSITLAFQPNQKMARQQAEDTRAWLAALAEKVAGRKMAIDIVVANGAAPRTPSAEPATRVSAAEREKQALADSTVQAILEIFPVEKTTVEEN